MRKQNNFRELGGILTKDGRMVKKGLFYRSGPPGKMNEEELDYVRSLKLRHVFDFRSDMEIAELAEPEIEGAVYHPVNALTDEKGEPVNFSPKAIEASEFDHHAGAAFLHMMYANLPFTKAYIDLFDVLKKGEVPILFHCTAGKDRTGIAAVLILLVLGADEKTALDDYVLTNEYRAEAIETFLKRMEPLISGDEEMRQALVSVEGVNRENAELSLASIRERFGTYDNFFEKQFGIDSEMRKKLIEMYTE